MFNLANKYSKEGRMDMAINLWNECVLQDKMFTPPLINLANTYKMQGNLAKAMECLVEFKRRPLTGDTFELLPKVNEEIQVINKQLNPEPAQK